MKIEKSNPLNKLNREQKAIISLFTGIHCGDFPAMHELAEELMGRPIFTHEFGNDKLYADLKRKVKPLFSEICGVSDGK